jgi:hypothetical protein
MERLTWLFMPLRGINVLNGRNNTEANSKDYQRG